MAAGSGVKLVRVRRAAWGITSGKFGAGSSGSDQDNPDDRFRQQLEQRYGIRSWGQVVFRAWAASWGQVVFRAWEQPRVEVAFGRPKCA